MRGDDDLEIGNDTTGSFGMSFLHAKIESALKALWGVEQDTVKILFNASKVKLDFDEEKVSIEEIEDSIKKLGYEVIKSKVK